MSRKSRLHNARCSAREVITDPAAEHQAIQQVQSRHTAQPPGNYWARERDSGWLRRGCVEAH
jgi:hypothetical protein